MKLRLHNFSILLLAIFALHCDAFAQSEPEAGAEAPKERFLVIVETSSAMQKRAENLQKAVGSVISSGLNKQIGEGSTIGLWTFNEKLYTGQLKLQLWTEASRQRVALNLVQFLQQQKYEKNSRLAAVWDAATNLIAHSERLTILLFTTGNDPITGTPFDSAITETYIKNQDQQKKQNMPFLTILRAVKGEFVAYAVNMPPWPLDVPDYPDGYKPIRAKPPEIVQAKPAPVPPPQKRADPALLSPTNTIYLAEQAASNLPATTAPPTPPAVRSNPPAIAKATLPSTNVAAPVAAAPTPPPPPRAETTPAVVPPESTAPITVRASQAKATFPIATLLVAGIALLLGVMLTFIALLRLTRRSTGASLITQSMNKDLR